MWAELFGLLFKNAISTGKRRFIGCPTGFGAKHTPLGDSGGYISFLAFDTDMELVCKKVPGEVFCLMNRCAYHTEAGQAQESAVPKHGVTPEDNSQGPERHAKTQQE